MADARKNFALVTVQGGYDADDTSITLQSGHGDYLPDPSVDGEYNLVWWNGTLYSSSGLDRDSAEVVRVTAKSGDTLTVTRAQEGSSATAKSTDGCTYYMLLGVTKKVLDDLDDRIDALALGSSATIQVDGVTQNDDAPTLDYDGTDFTLTESPDNDFDITLNVERIQDIVGAMLTGNTETGITVTYQDADGTIDFVVTGGGASELSDLTDVNTSTPTDKNVLVADGVDFESRALAADDIQSGTFADARISESSVTQHQAALSITESQISDLGTYLTDITGENIADLSDVVVTTPTDNEVLAYDNGSGDWINQTAAEAGLAAASHTHTESDITDLGAYITASSTDTLTNKSGNISQWTNDSGYITATLTQEQVEDYVGGMVTGNTETGISVTYEDGDGTLDFVVSDTTVAGDSGSTGITPGDTLTIAGGTNATTAMSGDTLTVNVDDAFLLNNGDVGTGVYDFGGATSFELPNSATPTVDADGEIAFDTTVTDFSTGLLRFYGNEEQGVVSMPIAQFTSPTDGYVVAYNGTNDEFELVEASGGLSSPATITANATTDNIFTLDGLPSHTGDLLRLQVNSSDVFVVDSNGVPSTPGQSGLTMGAGTTNTGINSTALGDGITLIKNSAVGVGEVSSVGYRAVSVGYNASTSGSANVYSVAVGSYTSAGSTGVAIGGSATATSSNVAVGAAASAANHGIAIGYFADSSGHNGSIVLGRQAVATDDYQFVVGDDNSSNGFPIRDVYIGNSVASANPLSTTYHATGGLGTDIAGADIIIAGGIGTGSGAGGHITFQTAAAGGSGSSANSLSTILELTDDAKIGFFGVTPVVRQTELTDELTTITHTAPGTPDYALQDLVDSGSGSAFGFATKDEGNTLLSVVANLQTRVNELETKLTAYGLLIDVD